VYLLGSGALSGVQKDTTVLHNKSSIKLYSQLLLLGVRVQVVGSCALLRLTE
jgi:hypothetical protein